MFTIWQEIVTLQWPWERSRHVLEVQQPWYIIAKLTSLQRKELLWALVGSCSTVEVAPVLKVMPSTVPDSVNLVGLQNQDVTWQKWVQTGKFRDWCVWQESSGLILSQREKHLLLVWVALEVVHADFLEIAHVCGHFVVDKTLDRLEQVVWWPAMENNVKHFVENCFSCAANNSNGWVKKGPLRHQRIVGPWPRIQIDFIGPLPYTRHSNQYCLVIIDSFSKWVEVFPAKNCMALTTACVLINQVFTHWACLNLSTHTMVHVLFRMLWKRPVKHLTSNNASTFCIIPRPQD